MAARPDANPGSRSTDSTTAHVHHFGWIPDKPDQRDHYFAVPRGAMVARLRVDLRSQCPSIYDQGQLGSCTANGVSAAIHFDRMKQQLTLDFIPSRLFANKPASKCCKGARKYKAVQYHAARRILSQMKGCLASGYPFVFGFTVCESFESQQVAQTGLVPVPAQTEKVLGGHCVVAVGYDDSQQRLIVRNSWGTGWGLQGHCTMPYAYLADANLSSDFWTVRLMSHRCPAAGSDPGIALSAASAERSFDGLALIERPVP